MGDRVGAQSGVVENRSSATLLMDTEEQGVAMFRAQLRPSGPIPTQTWPNDTVLGGHEDVNGVVDKNGHIYRVNRLEMKGVLRSARSL